MNTMKWLLKREYWEHKGGFLWAPIVVAAFIAVLSIGSLLFGNIVGNDKGIFHANDRDFVSLRHALSAVSEADKMEFATGLASGYPAIAVPVLITLGFVVFFYCLGNLYDERKDRSILFWKSLPVSDRDTVASKAITALVVAPIIAVAVALTLAMVIVLTLMVLAAFNGFNLFGAVFGQGGFYLTFVQTLAFLPVYALWALPTVGYLMFVSSWAKSKPFLWAVGVPVIGGVILNWVNMLADSPFNLGKYWLLVARGLGSVFPGSWTLAFSENSDVNVDVDNAMNMLLSASYELLTSANLWLGAAIGIAFLVGAIKMRRYRDEG